MSSRTGDLGVLEKPRFGELSKLLPVGIVVSTIVVLYVEYVLLHGLRLLQFDLPSRVREAELESRGIRDLSIFHVVTALLLYCLARCVLTHPGTIPDGSGWELQADSEDLGSAPKGVGLIETKQGGERRHCKWCLKYKPDRCHHCRVCNMCVLRMDHHCPWVYNCIGFRNHKFFFLLLVYAAIDLCIITVTMFDTVWWSTRTDVAISLMLTLIFGETFATFLFVITTTFLCFHIWLMAKAMTTVEFCEKSLKKSSYNSSVYSQGIYRNVCCVLGPQPLLWLLPISLPQGDGMTWAAVVPGSDGGWEVASSPSRGGMPSRRSSVQGGGGGGVLTPPGGSSARLLPPGGSGDGQWSQAGEADGTWNQAAAPARRG